MVPAQSPCQIWYPTSRDSVHTLWWKPREQHRLGFLSFSLSFLTVLFCSYWVPSEQLLCFVRWHLWYCLSPSAGEAVTFTRQYVLTPSAGRRLRVPGVVVIIADKRSNDDLSLAASSLKATGFLSEDHWHEVTILIEYNRMTAGVCFNLDECYCLVPMKAAYLTELEQFSWDISTTKVCVKM